MGTPDNVINLSTLYMKIYFGNLKRNAVFFDAIQLRCGNLKSGWRYEMETNGQSLS